MRMRALPEPNKIRIFPKIFKISEDDSACTGLGEEYPAFSFIVCTFGKLKGRREHGMCVMMPYKMLKKERFEIVLRDLYSHFLESVSDLLFTFMVGMTISFQVMSGRSRASLPCVTFPWRRDQRQPTHFLVGRKTDSKRRKHDPSLQPIKKGKNCTH
jgi:hypothetical protein